MTNARDSYGPILESLLPLYPNLMRTGYARLAPTDRKVGHFAHGWFLRCQRSVEALLVLDAAGYWEEAAPIRRTIIENVLALKWLAAEGDSVNAAMAREHRYNVEKRLAAVTAAGWSSVNVADLQQIIAEVDATVSEDPNKYPLTFARRVKVYGDEHTIPGYLAECSKSHPTYQAAATYFNVTPTGPHLLGRPRAEDRRDQVGFATTQMLDGLIHLHFVFNPRPWVEDLDEALARHREVDAGRASRRRSPGGRLEPGAHRRRHARSWRRDRYCVVRHPASWFLSGSEPDLGWTSGIRPGSALTPSALGRGHRWNPQALTLMKHTGLLGPPGSQRHQSLCGKPLNSRLNSE